MTPPAPPPGLTPDFVLGFVLLGLVIIFVMARLMGALAQKLGQPRVVGEIVAGVLLGPTLLGTKTLAWNNSPEILHCNDSLEIPFRAGAEPAPESISACLFPPQARGPIGILGQIALILFMFLVGVELDYRLLRGKGKGILTVAIGVIAIPVALAFLVAPALANSKFQVPGSSDTAFTLMIGAMLAVTAFPVMARILQEKGLTQSDMGAIGVAAAAVVTVLMFLTLAVANGVAKDKDAGEHTLVFIGAALFLAAMFLVVKPLLARFVGRPYEAAGQLTQGTFAAVLIVAFASGYIADRIGINVIVGGFVAGAVMPARERLFRDMAARLSDFTAVILLPVFLAFSGLNTDFTSLGSSFIVGIAIFLVAGIVAKWAGGAVAARVGGLSWKEGNVLGILMNCRGLLVLVVALAALNAGVITPQLQVGGVLMALVTTAMTGPLFDRFQPAQATPLSESTPAEGPVPRVEVHGVPLKRPPAG